MCSGVKLGPVRSLDFAEHGQESLMPLGIGTWFEGCQAQNSWHCGRGVSPVPPHPSPFPKERVLCRSSCEISGCFDLSPCGR